MTPAVRRRPLGLAVSVTDGRGRPVRSPGLGGFLTAAAPPGTAGQITIALVGDATMRRLNRQFLGHDYATDVLSFPRADEREPAGRSRRPKAQGRRPKKSVGRSGAAMSQPAVAEPGPLALGPWPSSLGDVAIARGVARRQARAAGHSLGVELRILALHGLLHLLGYDHETDQGDMGRLEERLRRRAGLPAGLIARAPGRPRRR